MTAPAATFPAFDGSAHSPTRTTRMPALPDDIFQRKMSHRILRNAQDAINEYKKAANLEGRLSAEAGFYALAIDLLREIRRFDLVSDFEAHLQTVLAEAQAVKPMRIHEPKAPPLPESALRKAAGPDSAQKRKKRS